MSGYPAYGYENYPQQSPLLQQQPFTAAAPPPQQQYSQVEYVSPTGPLYQAAAPVYGSPGMTVVATAGATVTSTPVAGTGLIGTATSADDVAFEDGADLEQIAKREMFEFDHYDATNNPVISIMLEGRGERGTQIETALSIATLFNSIVTVMVICSNFKRNASPETVNAFGANWPIVTDIIVYAPLVFFLLVLLTINNYYSERVFYEHLRRGILLDFPNSGEIKYIFANWRPLLFLVLFLAYLLTAVGVMIKGGATLGTIVTLLTNLVIGICLWWWRQQSIESRLISLPDFVMCFPQRDARNKSIEQRIAERVDTMIDETSLKFASYFMKKVVLNFTEQPSWSDSMRLHTWKNRNYAMVEMMCFHGAVWILLGSCVGACIAYFVVLGNQDVTNVWSQTINPCFSSCAAVSNSVTATNFTASACNSCLCTCMEVFAKVTDAYTSVCPKYASLPSQCGGVTTLSSVCASLSSCPAH